MTSTPYSRSQVEAYRVTIEALLSKRNNVWMALDKRDLDDLIRIELKLQDAAKKALIS